MCASEGGLKRGGAYCAADEVAGAADDSAGAADGAAGVAVSQAGAAVDGAAVVLLSAGSVTGGVLLMVVLSA